jgi:hypothetical protein
VYYKMDWRIDQEALGLNLAEQDVIPATPIPWTMGMHCDDKLDEPIEVSLDPNYGTDLPDAFLVGIPCFSERLSKLLHSLGVDNFQEYEIVLVDPRDNRKILNYKAVNIVGLVQCADLSASEYFAESGPPLMDFYRLVVDEKKAGGMSFFRLYEDADTILVHERIAKHLIAAKLVGVDFKPVESSVTNA